MWKQSLWKWTALSFSVLLVASCARSTTLSREELAAALKEHPDILLETLEQNRIALADIVERGFKERVEKARQAEIERSVHNPLKPAIDPDRPSLGRPDARVTLVEYSDFFCQYCPQGTRTAKTFVARHTEDLRFFYKHLPMSDPSHLAATYFEAVAIQDAELAWVFMDRIFSDQKHFLTNGEPALVELARELGLDIDRLGNDVRSQTVQSRIQQDMQEAAAMGIRGTPTFVLGGVPIRGAAALEEFENVLRVVAPPAGEEAPVK
jgi:protein-disulfide isomerase